MNCLIKVGDVNMMPSWDVLGVCSSFASCLIVSPSENLMVGPFGNSGACRSHMVKCSGQYPLTPGPAKESLRHSIYLHIVDFLRLRYTSVWNLQRYTGSLVTPFGIEDTAKSSPCNESDSEEGQGQALFSKFPPCISLETLSSALDKQVLG